MGSWIEQYFCVPCMLNPICIVKHNFSLILCFCKVATRYANNGASIRNLEVPLNSYLSHYIQLRGPCVTDVLYVQRKCNGDVMTNLMTK